MISMATSAIPGVSKEARRKRRRRSCLLSCFAPPAVLGSAADDQTKASASSSGADDQRRQKQLAQSRFGAKKTVPVDFSVAGSSPARSEVDGAGAPPEEAKKKSTRNSLFRRFSKKRSQKDHNIRPNQQIPINSNGQDEVHHMASKCSTRVEPAPLHRMHDQTRIGTRTSHPGSPVASHRAARPGQARGKGSNFYPSSGLFVLTVALAMLLFGGKICATVCMCAWFYLLPQARQPSLLPDAMIRNSDGRGEVDVSSEEHKKMVVLQGLLQRDGRRPSRIFSSIL